MLCDVGEYEAGLDYLQRSVAKGYYAWPTLSSEPAVRRVARQCGVSGGDEKAEAAANGRWRRFTRRTANACSACEGLRQTQQLLARQHISQTITKNASHIVLEHLSMRLDQFLIYGGPVGPIGIDRKLFH